MATKREHGTGTCYFVKGRDVWRVRLIVDGKSITRHAKTQKEAKALLKQLIRDQKELASQNKYNSKSFAAYADNWLTVYKKSALASSSYRNLKYDIDHYVKPHIGTIQLANLNTDDIQSMINQLVMDGKSLSLIKRARSAVDSCLKKAVQLKDIPYNPCTAIEMPTAKKNETLKKRPICVLDDIEVERYCASATSSWPNRTPHYRIGWGFVLVLATGMRRGELAALQWSDIDMESNQMHIHGNAALINDEDRDTNRKTKQIIQDSTKTSSGDRYIPLNNTALTALRQLKSITGNFKYVVGVSDHAPVNVSTLAQMHNRILNRANITRSAGTKTGMHCLRHTFCSHLICKGTDIKTVSEIMGHADIGVTLDVYGHIFEKQKQTAVTGAEIEIINKKCDSMEFETKPQENTD